MIATAIHLPVMVAEIVSALAVRPGATVTDATFGDGGYAEAILAAGAAQVWGIDRDPDAHGRAAGLLRRHGGRLALLSGRFGELDRLLAEQGVHAVDGVAFDLGVSSDQMEVSERGFSFRRDGPLDMRMDPRVGEPAADVVALADEGELASLIWRYGEERASRRIAAAIVRARQAAPIRTTAQLADIVHRAIGFSSGPIDSATRTFQALRIYVNDELGELDRGLDAAERILAPGGRLAVVSYHSLEDRRVKDFLRVRAHMTPGRSRHLPEAEPASAPPPTFRLLRRGVWKPSAAEVQQNPRARSARLRAAERTSAAAWTPASHGLATPEATPGRRS